MADTRTTPNGTPPETAAARPVIPGFELQRRIGQGSYGEVWLARDAAGRFHAIKVVYRKTFEHERPFEREFSGIQKFEPVSRTHSSQVAIQQVGRDQEAGYFYYAMEIADDEMAGQQINPFAYVPKTIKSELRKRGRLSFHDCLDIGLCLTTALEHLHKHGLIHRDIKPSNIIYVNGVPKLADIGLVTDLGATISYVGTEGFLPPEGPVSQQADIYSLGKVLYEAATGRDRLDFPELPTFLGPPQEKDELLELNLVFLKACQNDVRKRYQTAHEMHADLALLQSGKSLRRARALEERLRNFTRLGAAVAVIGLVVAGSYYWVSQQRLRESERERQTAEMVSRQARKEAEDTLDRFVDFDVAHGNELLRQGDVPGALLWFAEAAATDHPDATNQQPHKARLLECLRQSPKVWTVFAHRGPVATASFSADGRRILTTSPDGTAQVWDGQTGEAIGPLLDPPASLALAMLSPDGQLVATAGTNGTVRLWTAGTGDPAGPALSHGGAVRQVLFSRDGRQLLTLGEDSTAKVWNTSGGLMRSALVHPDSVLDAIFSADSRLIATVCRDRSVRLWHAASGDAAGRPLPHEGPVSQAAFSPDGRRVLTVCRGEVRLWNTATGDAAAGVLRHDGDVRSASFSPDGTSVLTAGEDRTARIWDAVSGQLRVPPLPHDGPVSAAAFSPDGRYIVTASGPGVRLWNATTGQPVAPPFLHNDRVLQVAFSPDSQRILTASSDGTARLLDRTPGITVSPGRDAATAEEIVRAPTILNTTNAVDSGVLRTVAQFLSGRRIETNGQAVPLAPEAQRTLWRALRQKWPTAFRLPDPRAWHSREAEAAEQAQEWFAAVFHWNHALAADRTNDPWLRRRDQAVRQLALRDATVTRRVDLPQRIPPRPSNARPQLIDLTDYYNAALSETWLPSRTLKTGNDLSGLPQGVQKFNGIEFDVRGVIQLAGSGLEDLGGKFPRAVDGIKIDRKCRRLHFLFGAVRDAKVRTRIGGFRVHLGRGEPRECWLTYGDNVREWWSSPPRLQLPAAAMAWEGSNPASRDLGLVLRLYQITWANPLPEEEITRIDFFSTMEKPAPFLIAVTAD